VNHPKERYTLYVQSKLNSGEWKYVDIVDEKGVVAFAVELPMTLGRGEDTTYLRLNQVKKYLRYTLLSELHARHRYVADSAHPATCLLCFASTAPPRTLAMDSPGFGQGVGFFAPHKSSTRAASILHGYRCGQQPPVERCRGFVCEPCALLCQGWLLVNFAECKAYLRCGVCCGAFASLPVREVSAILNSV
jgi:hypothetical protein